MSKFNHLINTLTLQPTSFIFRLPFFWRKMFYVGNISSEIIFFLENNFNWKYFLKFDSYGKSTIADNLRQQPKMVNDLRQSPVVDSSGLQQSLGVTVGSLWRWPKTARDFPTNSSVRRSLATSSGSGKWTTRECVWEKEKLKFKKWFKFLKKGNHFT
jgi:hypothetical protein